MSRRPTEDPAWLRRLLLALVLLFLLVTVALPLFTVAVLALADGVGPALAALMEPETRAALRLTLLVAAMALPINVAFGVAAAWLLARFTFRGKGLLLTLVDLPFSVSPVIAGLVFVLLFGRGGLFAASLDAWDIQVIFAVPCIALVTTFVTLPFVARELLPVLERLGRDQEEAAYTLGAGPWRTFFLVTLPQLRWGLLHGVVLANARAMGEFGAVSVVSGHIRGLTTTLPLEAELRYHAYDSVGAFSVAALLALLAVGTLAIKGWVARRAEADGAHA